MFFCHKTLSFFVFFFFFFNLHSQTYNNLLVDGDYEDRNIVQVLQSVENQYGVRFFFENEIVSNNPAKTVNWNQIPLGNALSELLENTDLSFEEIENIGIAIAPKTALGKEYSLDFFANQHNERIQGLDKKRPQAEIISIGNPNNPDPDGTVKIKGFVIDKVTEEPVIGVTLFIEELGIGSASEVDGSFELDLPVGTHFLEIQAVGYRENYRELKAFSNGEFQIELDVKSFQLDEVVIKARGDNVNVRETQIGIKELKISELKELPTFLGEVDVIQGLLSLPGVTTVGEGSSGFNVRGGNIDQNLILQDGAPVLNSSHVLGFFSIFNSEAIENVTLYKGNLPAQYGGRISAVLDVETKDGNFKKLHGSGGVGIASSRLMFEGPIVREKTSFLVSARGSYSDWMLKQAKSSLINLSSTWFYDFNAKLTQKIGDKTRIALSTYQSKDFFRYAKDFGYEWSTRLFDFQWQQIYGPYFSSTLTAVSGNYESDYFSLSGASNFRLKNGMEYYKLQQNFFYVPFEKMTLNFGVDWVAYDGKPETIQPESRISAITPESILKEQGQEFGFYINDEINLNDRIGFSVGLRYSLFQNKGPYSVYSYEVEKKPSTNTIIGQTEFSKNETIAEYSGWEPRISLRIGLDESSSIKLSYNKLRQYIHLVSNTAASTPADVWQLSNRYIKPISADNYSFGFFKNLKDNHWETSVEFYYKNIKDILEYKDFADLFLNDHLETELLNGKGKSYGIELAINKKEGALQGSVAYSYSRSLRKVDGLTAETSVNNGDWFPSNFDKPHQFTFMFKHKPNQKRAFTMSFSYNTGRPITVPINSYEIGGVVVPNFGDRNEFRIPDFHRMDISYTITAKVWKRAGYKGTVTFSIYNLYFHKNAFSVFFKREPPKFTPTANRFATLGTAFPAVTYNFKF